MISCSKMYQKMRVKDATLLFSDLYLEKYPQYEHLTFTLLCNYIAVAEFTNISTTGHPMFGLTYCATENGPFPIELENEEYKCSTYFYTENDLIFANKNHGVDFNEYFSQNEVELLKKSFNIFENNQNIVKEFPVYKKAKIGEFVHYDWMFDDNFLSKKEQTLAEENFSILLMLHY